MRLEREPRLLDLFCGAGGATKGYQDAGFYVVGVDKTYQPNYCGNAFIQMDAIKFLEEGGSLAFSADEFDAIHASPPCQFASSKTLDKSKHENLLTPTLELLKEYYDHVPWTVENVEGARDYMDSPKLFCGSSFAGLKVRRHRLFQTNWDLLPPLGGCMHSMQDEDKRFILYDHGKWYKSGIVHVFGTGGGKGREYWPMAMGMGETWDDCWMTPAEMAEAIPPSYTRWIGNQLMSRLEQSSNAA